MKKYFIKKIGIILMTLFISISVNAQGRFLEEEGEGGGGSGTVTIYGSSYANQNDIKTYTAIPGPGLTIYNAFWSVNGGVIQSQNTTSITIKWTSSGLYSIDYEVTSSNQGNVTADLPVFVTAVATPATPSTPTISSQNCTTATLQKSGNPPSGVTWYWQDTNSAGTSTSYNATSNYTAVGSNVYYIRARNSSGIWSATSAAIIVSLQTGGTTWYADYDGDGKGDPNDTLSQCTQPANFVSNNSDLCPGEHGGSNSNGCATAVTLSNENFVYTITPQTGVTSIPTNTNTSDYIKNVIYFDGLGRGEQTIAIRQSAESKDIITHLEYNTLGQQEKEYLPYVPTTSGSDGLLRSTALSNTNSFYVTNYSSDINAATPNPYAQKTVEASPLNRVLEQAAPGDDWKKTTNLLSKGYSDGHTIKFEYDTNSASEVKEFKATTNSSFTPTLVLSPNNNGYYYQGELIKISTKDENWTNTDGVNYTTEEFKNKNGQLVLKRNYNASIAHDTYYVYDNFGNLTYVLPPKMDANTASISTVISNLNTLGYQYKYDHRMRLVEKKIPGKNWEFIVYDNLDRPVLIQDANQRTTKKWLFTKYDVLGRIVYTGVYTDPNTGQNILDRVDMQNHFNSQNNAAAKYYETKETSSGSLGIYYSNSDFPNANIEVLTVNYYDNYTFNRAGTGTTVNNGYGVNSTTNVKGLATGSRIKVLGTSNWITTVSYYDDKARSIYIYSKNDFLQTTDIVKTDLDFVGKVDETITTHTKSNGNHSTQSIKDVFTYDHAGRLKIHTQYLNGSGTGEILVSNTYNELGQLKSKGVGGKTTQSRLQTVDYTYNVRGWLKNINQDANNDNDLFNFSLMYNNPTSGTALYNGNISQTSWNTLNTDSSTKTYTYNYDALNRITSGISSNANYNLGLVTYDKNGNIERLTRKGHTNTAATTFGTMDDLYYYYNGNQLHSVTDNGNDTYGFKDGNASDNIYNGGNGNDDFKYDVNGNMTKDANKNITNISYNHLNLPTVVTINGQNISYTYDAIGTKLRKVFNSTTIDYAGNYIYENNNLKYFNTAEGYFNVTSTSSTVSGNYVYYYKDHLDNIRLSYADTNNNGSIAQSEIITEKNYYPFGLTHKGYNTNSSSHLAEKKGFGSKEYQEENNLNWYDVTARNYDPALGRWMNLDPLAEQMRRHSPYNFAFNNPIYFQDYDGMAPTGPDGPVKVETIKSTYTYNKDGSHTVTSTESTTIMQVTQDEESWDITTEISNKTTVSTYTVKDTGKVDSNGAPILEEKSTVSTSTAYRKTVAEGGYLSNPKVIESKTNLGGKDGTKTVSLNEQSLDVKHVGQFVKANIKNPKAIFDYKYQDFETFVGSAVLGGVVNMVFGKGGAIGTWVAEGVNAFERQFIGLKGRGKTFRDYKRKTRLNN